MQKVGATRIEYDAYDNVVSVWSVKMDGDKPLLDKDGDEIWHGPNLTWGKNKKLYMYIDYVDDEVHGMVRRYYDDGSLHAEERSNYGVVAQRQPPEEGHVCG